MRRIPFDPSGPEEYRGRTVLPRVRGRSFVINAPKKKKKKGKKAQDEPAEEDDQ